MTFFALLLSHLLGDFIFQPEALVLWKQKSWKGILAHVGIHLLMNAIFFLFFLQDLRVLGLLTGIVFLHFWIDYGKIFLEKKSKLFAALFFLDQFFHIAVLGLATFLMQQISMPLLTSWNHVPAYKTLFLSFFILAIFSTACIEIGKFQFLRRKNPKMKLEMNWQEMTIRFVVMCLTFLTVLLLFRP